MYCGRLSNPLPLICPRRIEILQLRDPATFDPEKSRDLCENLARTVCKLIILFIVLHRVHAKLRIRV